MVLSIRVAGAAAIVLTILAVLTTIFPAVFAPILATVFPTVLAAIFAAILSARGLIGLTGYCGGRQQGAGDEQCSPQL